MYAPVYDFCTNYCPTCMDNSNSSYYSQIINFSSNNDLTSKYEDVKQKSLEYMNSNSNGNMLNDARLIHEYIQNNVYNNYVSGESTLEHLLDTGEGNCLATTSLFYLIVSDLLPELDINVVTPEGHIATVINYEDKKYFVENTISNGFNINFDEKYTIHEDGESAILAALYNNLASKQANLELALRYYENANRINSNMESVNRNLSTIYARLGNTESANHYSDVAVKINSNKKTLVINEDVSEDTFEYEINTIEVEDLDMIVISSKPNIEHNGIIEYTNYCSSKYKIENE